MVENDWLRDAFLDSDMTASTVARALGWEVPRRASTRPDASRVRHALGLTPNRSNGGYVAYQRRVHLTLANRIADVLGIAHYDAGDCVSCGERLRTPVADQTCGFCHAEALTAASQSSSCAK